MRGFAGDGTVFFEFAELRGQDFLGDTGKEIAEFSKSLRPEGEIPKGENFPFAGEDVQGGFDRTAVVLLHGGLRAYKFVRTSVYMFAVIA